MYNIQENFSLKSYNTFGIDVRAEKFISFGDIKTLDQIITEEKLRHLNPFILGGGSNLLLTDDVKGFVLKNDILGITTLNENSEHSELKVGAGVNWHSFVLYAIDKNLGGIENLSLIPGNVGASPIQNIGAYGVEVKDVITSVEAYHLDTGKTVQFSNADCNFGYRDSIFKNEKKGEYVITHVCFKLSKQPVLNTSYGAIEDELAKNNITSPTIKDISNAVIAIRSSKLPNPAEIGNSGSFFKNPVVERDVFESIKLQFPDIAHYPSGNKIKLAAGWLIEKAGWKGFRQEDFGVHAKQALVLVNYGKASGKEIYELSENIIASIYQKFGVTLEREVNLL